MPAASLVLVVVVAEELQDCMVAAQIEPFVVEEQAAAAGQSLVGWEREGAVLPPPAVVGSWEVAPLGEMQAVEGQALVAAAVEAAAEEATAVVAVGPSSQKL